MKHKGHEMVDCGSILIADDEETFLKSTARLLSREGYDCDCALDADEACEKLRANRYDLLIADIKMPGNPRLELVQQAQRLAQGMPVILVTGYPSLDSAVRSVELPVVAYLMKPLDFEELRAHVRVSIECSQTYHMVSHVREYLQKCVQDLEKIERGGRWPNGRPAGAMGEISTVMVRTLASCLSELLKIKATSAADKTPPDLCELLDCPQRPVHAVAIQEAIEVLKKSKSTFKSKDLAELRVRLEAVLEKSGRLSDSA